MSEETRDSTEFAMTETEVAKTPVEVEVRAMGKCEINVQRVKNQKNILKVYFINFFKYIKKFLNRKKHRDDSNLLSLVSPN